MYTAGEVKGILSYYMTLSDEHAGSLAHLKAMDLRKHFPRLPYKVKQVLFLHGLMGMDALEVSNRLEISREGVLVAYNMGSESLAARMNNG